MTTGTPGAGPRSAFLAGPFKALVDPSSGEMREFERRRYEALITYLESQRYFVHNAHRRELWGKQFLSPSECTAVDYAEIRGCDLFVAFPGYPASPGTHIEIGWASALGKRMILLLESGCEYAFLVQGLHTVADVTFADMPSASLGVEQFAAALTSAEQRWARAPGDSREPG
jgi:nucleoside 2-deoxyribosyltransferase